MDWVTADGNKAHNWLYSPVLRALNVFAKEFPDDARLAEYWKDADKTHPELADARKRLGALESNSR
jgi:hypothetical protein